MLDAQLDGQLGGAVEFERQRVAQLADAAEHVLGQQLQATPPTLTSQTRAAAWSRPLGPEHARVGRAERLTR